MNGDIITDSYVDSEELQRIETEVTRLEQLSATTTIKLSDVAKLIREVRRLRVHNDTLKLVLARAQEVARKVSDKLYTCQDRAATEAQSMIEFIVWNDEADRTNTRIVLVERIMLKIAEALASGKTISKEDSLGDEVRRAAIAIGQYNTDP